MLFTNKPFIIAEMSGNHNKSLKRALEIVEKAKEAGVDAVKLQTYTPDTITLNVKNNDFLIMNPNSHWYGRNLYDLYKEAYLPWEWHEDIFKKCKELGLYCFSSPFDESAVDFLEKLNAPFYKIASFEMNDLNLIEKVAKTKKPIIMSTGMATLSEIDNAVRTVKKYSNSEIVLLKCTSNYPADPADSNLLTIPHMKQLFNCGVGLSDHTIGIGTSVASIALGAQVIEKHFTLSRSDGGVDADFSLEPFEMKQLVKECNQAFKSLGKIKYGPNGKEDVEGRRSLYVAEDIKAGELFTKKNIKSVRPGYGLPTKYLNIIVGRIAKTDLKKGTRVTWDLL